MFRRDPTKSFKQFYNIENIYPLYRKCFFEQTNKTFDYLKIIFYTIDYTVYIIKFKINNIYG